MYFSCVLPRFQGQLGTSWILCKHYPRESLIQELLGNLKLLLLWLAYQFSACQLGVITFLSRLWGLREYARLASPAE